MVWHMLVVEDEDWAWESLQHMLSQCMPDKQPVLTRLATVREAVTWLSEHPVDLIFMDIYLADGLSLEIFKQVGVKAPVIFTTAYEKYALQAFRNQGYAYLLKPFDIDDLRKALEKVRPLLPQKPNAYKRRFLVKYGIHLKSLPVEEVAYFMADDKTLYAVEKEGQRYIIDESLMSLVKKLDPKVFFQINRKFVIQLSAINSMRRINRGRIKLDLSPAAPAEVIVSEERSPGFQLWLDQ